MESIWLISERPLLVAVLVDSMYVMVNIFSSVVVKQEIAKIGLSVS